MLPSTGGYAWRGKASAVRGLRGWSSCCRPVSKKGERQKPFVSDQPQDSCEPPGTMISLDSADAGAWRQANFSRCAGKSYLLGVRPSCACQRADPGTRCGNMRKISSLQVQLEMRRSAGNAVCVASASGHVAQAPQHGHSGSCAGSHSRVSDAEARASAASI